MSDNRHENHEILNLIGYGLAKFDLNFVRAFGFTTKTAFYKSMISKGIANSMERSRIDRIYLIPFLTINVKAGGKKEMLIFIERLLLTHYLRIRMRASLRAL